MLEAIGNIKMHYKETGNGEPVVLITGLGGDVSFWKGMTPLLSRRYRVITLDNRGSGLTEYPNGPFDIEALADDIALLLDHLSIPKAHILGWSMGGNVAQDLALRHPGKVASLTLVSTYMRRPSRSSYIMNAMVGSVQSGGDLIYLFTVMQSLCMTEEAFREMEDKGICTPWRLNSTLEGFLRQLAAVDGFDSRDRAKGIRAPTMVIHGGADIMVPPRMGKELAAEIPGAGFTMIEGGGHTMPPKTYAKAFLDHIEGHPIS